MIMIFIEPDIIKNVETLYVDEDKKKKKKKIPTNV